LLTTVNHFTSCRAKTEDLALDALLVCYRAFGEISLRRYKVIESSSFYLAFYHSTTKNKDSYLHFLKKIKNCSNCEETQRTIFHINNLKVSPGNNNVAISNTLKMEDLLKQAILNLPDSFG